jgi:diadenosine tetraphosphate (Ap4A) HIT family hydrolase
VIAKTLFALAKRPVVGRAVGAGFAYGGALLPVRRVLVTARAIVFYHPKPAWRDHLLIVPKRPIRTLLHLASPRNDAFFADIILAARRATELLGLQGRDFVLLANGGPRQEVQQVHFHLFTGESYVNPLGGPAPAETLLPDPEVAVLLHPRPNWETHLRLRPRRDLPPLADLTAGDAAALRHLLHPLGALDERYRLTARGYSLFAPEDDMAASRRLTFHLVAGGRRQEPDAPAAYAGGQSS